MRSTLLLICLILLSHLYVGCRKPDYVYRSPCEDSTLLSLYERRGALNIPEQHTFDSLLSLCEKHTATEENRGKLWPGILAGLAIVAAVGTLLLWLLLRRNTDIVD